jgi:hypothetical protein
MKANVLVLSALLALLPVAAVAAPCDSEKYRQFDFWIGDWTVVNADGQVVGSNRIERILGGCGLQENWRGADGSEGRSLNMFFELDGKWHQSWVDRNGGRLDLVGGRDKKGRPPLSGKMPSRQGGTALHEISWTPNGDGSVRQHWRASRDRGKTWTDLFVGVYRRAE